MISVTVRDVEAASTAIAELYKYGAAPGSQAVSLGRYRMPFRVRVEKLQ